jgi:hypothetical protein
LLTSELIYAELHYVIRGCVMLQTFNTADTALGEHHICKQTAVHCRPKVT